MFFLICAGGTIDKAYAEGAGVYNFDFAYPPGAVKLLARLEQGGFTERLLLGIHAFGAGPGRTPGTLPKDSLDMTDADREAIATLCDATPAERILVTHGTDTIAMTGRAIAARRLPKTIVLTGAAQPYVVRESDAEWNLGFAIGAVEALHSGVYVALSGRVLDPHACYKHPLTGRFSDRP